MKAFYLSLCLLFMACVANNTPGAELLATQQTFAATVRSLTKLRQAGRFNARQIKDISKLIAETDVNIKAWENAYIAGLHRPNLPIEVRRALTALIAWESKAKE